MAVAQVAPLPPTTRLVALATAPAPTESSFSISAAQDLTVTLTDLQVPAALSTATVVVTQGGTLVGDATLTPPATTAAVSVPGAMGQYTLRVFGAPNASESVGTFTVCVAPKANPSNCIQSASLAGNISASSSAANPTVSTLSLNLTVTTAGAYTVTFADDQFPVALQSAPNLALFQGSAVVQEGIPSGTTLNLTAGTYTLLGIAQADQTLKAGLYQLLIAGPTGTAPLLNMTSPVGILGPPVQAQNPSAQALTLKVSDFAFPAPLANASAIATAGATNLGMASSAATATFAAPAGEVQVWSFATPGSDAGTYEVDLTSPSAALLQTAAGVANGSSQAYAFVTPTLTAGTLVASASDFQFPAALGGLQFAVAQNASILASSPAAGSVNVTAAAAPAVVLVDAITPASGNGLFDVNLQSTAMPAQLIFDKTQGVGTSNIFDSQTINFGSSGNFTVSLSDLAVPAAFDNLALVVSSGGSVVGSIFGGGNFPIPVTPGPYQLTFIATPSAQQQYGLYAVQISYTAPSVTLTANPTTVPVGGTTTLSWTTTNATSCTAAGGNWTGSPATGSGMVALVVSATTTYTLTCTGPGGTTAQSVVVTATAVQGSSHGGGNLDWAVLMFLGMLSLARLAISMRVDAAKR
jgi:hypothetical protein